MEGDFIKINEWLTPLSWLYGIGVGIRNQMFELGILKSKAFDVPVISVGNITVGGSGKTPHVEYLIRQLHDKVKVAVLSRGYKRKSRGYVLADKQSTARDIGDESYQILKKFPGIYVAVDKKRCNGIERLTSDEATKDTDVILLDDAYQHRYVKPGINILLVDYHRLIIYDKLLPAGRLREPQSGKARADIVIITKCPADLKPMEFRVLTKALNLYPYQKLFFTTLEYGDLQPLYCGEELPLKEIPEGTHVLLLTGIASPKQMIIDLKPFVSDIVPNNARLFGLEGLSEEVRHHIYQLPVRIKFMLGQEEEFNEKIIGYVRKNSRNSILVKTKDDNKPKDSNRAGNGPRTISFRNNG